MTVDQLPPSAFERRLLDAFIRDLSAPASTSGSDPGTVSLTLADSDEPDLPLYAPTPPGRRSNRAGILAAAAALLLVAAVSAALVAVNRDGSGDSTPLLSSAPDSDTNWEPLTDGEYSYRHISRISSQVQDSGAEAGEWEVAETGPAEFWIAGDGSGYWTSDQVDGALQEVPFNYFKVGGHRPAAALDTGTLVAMLRDETRPRSTSGAVGIITDHLSFEATDPATRDALVGLLVEIGFDREGDTYQLDIADPVGMPGHHEVTLVPGTSLLQSWTVTVDGEVIHGLFVHDLGRAGDPTS